MSKEPKQSRNLPGWRVAAAEGQKELDTLARGYRLKHGVIDLDRLPQTEIDAFNAQAFAIVCRYRPEVVLAAMMAPK